MQHQYHTKIDDLIEKTSAAMSQGMISKLVAVLETTLSKLGRYDEGSLIGSILSFTVSICISLNILVALYLNKCLIQPVLDLGKVMA